MSPNQQQFERWAKREAIPLSKIYVPTRNGQRMEYVSDVAAHSWFAWQASRRALRRTAT